MKSRRAKKIMSKNLPVQSQTEKRHKRWALNYKCRNMFNMQRDGLKTDKAHGKVPGWRRGW